jgi:hypothetical protein
MSLRATIALAGITAIGLVSAGRILRDQRERALPLQVDPVQLDLGTVWLQERITREITIKNTSASAVRITSFERSCECTEITPSNVLLAPESAVPISVTIDPAKITLASPERGVWSIDVAIQPVTDRPSGSATWRLAGQLHSPLKTLPVNNVTPRTFFKTDVPREESVTIRLKHGMTLKQVTPHTKGTACRFVRLGPDSYRVCFLVDPARIDPGVSLAQARLHINDSSARSLPPFPLSVACEVLPSVTLDRAVVLIQRPRTAEGIRLTSTIGEEFEVVSVESPAKVTTEVMDGLHAYRASHKLRIQAETSDTLALSSVNVVVRSRGSDIKERLTVLVQQPISVVGEVRD